MAARIISLKDIGKELGKKFVEHEKKEVIEATYEACLRSVEPMKYRSPVDTGLYASAWEVKKTNQPGEVFFGNTAPYAGIVEYGARPFNAPIRPLEEWAARKLRLPVTSPEVQNFAWAVKKKIQREGMEPKFILESGTNEVLLPMIRKEMDKL